MSVFEQIQRGLNEAIKYESTLTNLLNKLGISIRYSDGSFRPMDEIFEDLYNAWDKLSKEEKDRIYEQIGEGDIAFYEEW